MSEKNNTLDMSVKIFPVHDKKSLLATASVELGGCFAIRGIHVMDSEKGAFVSMPQRQNSKGEYRDICFPTTAEMREAINTAVLTEYQRATERSYNRAEQAVEKRASLLGKIRENRAAIQSPKVSAPAKGMDMGAR